MAKYGKQIGNGKTIRITIDGEQLETVIKSGAAAWVKKQAAISGHTISGFIKFIINDFINRHNTK